MFDSKQTTCNFVNISIKSAVKAVAIDGLLTFVYSYDSGCSSTKAFYKTFISTTFSFLSYELRGLTRECVETPESVVKGYTYLSAAIGGAFKYVANSYFNDNQDSLENMAIMGAINNAGYEVSKDLKIDDNLQVFLLEGGETFAKSTFMEVSNGNINFLKALAQAFTNAAGQAFIIEKIYVPVNDYVSGLSVKLNAEVVEPTGNCTFNVTDMVVPQW